MEVAVGKRVGMTINNLCIKNVTTGFCSHSSSFLAPEHSCSLICKIEGWEYLELIW